MNKVLKIISLLFISFVLTGCSVEYNLIINEDKTVTEKIEITDLISNFESKGFNISLNDYLDTLIESYEKDKDFKNYDITKILDNTVYGIQFNTTYNSISEYIDSVKKYDHIIGNINTSNKNNRYSISTDGVWGSGIFRPDDGSNRLLDTVVNVKVQSYYDIIDSNAHQVYENTNTYEWMFDSSNYENGIIEISFDDNVLVNNNEVSNFTSNNIFLIIILIVVSAVFIFIWINRRRSNKI